MLPKDAYQRVLAPLAASTIIPVHGVAIPTPSDVDAAALLYLALTQGRRGQAGFNPAEHVAPSAIQTRTIANSTNTASIQVKIFVDSWGNPVRHWTFPYGNVELNSPPYSNAFSQNQQSPD